MCEEEFLQKKIIRRAMHLLEHMDRTEKGLRDKLRQSDYPEDMIEYAIAYVKSYGYVDDARYARNYIRYRLDQKTRQQLMQELYRKGVDRRMIQEAWEEIAQEEQPDERRLLRSLLLKKSQGKKQLTKKEYQRLQGYLARKGFSWEDIAAVMEEEKIELIY
ncbi:MAG: regulatory protein RecX [Lachnospiraceae bacterium]|nr:recombination regulator RecX [Lachnospiraceae bacterium]MDD6617941.1 regulatory protein RecX [Clostridiales bacterium]MDY4771006.1 regulatory protein RecX [Lachnospiraceae bacterium]